MLSTLLTRYRHKSPKDQRKLKSVIRHLESKHKQFADRRGHRMAVFANDHIGARIYTEGLYEKEELADLSNIIQILGIDPKKSTAIDIGANVGNHAIEFSKYFKHVEAFEPNPHTFRLLRFNCDYTPNVSAHNLGLGDRSCTLELSESDTNYGASSAVHNRGKKNKIKIKIEPLDNFLEQLQEVKLIKIAG